jgi:acyl carrier protein
VTSGVNHHASALRIEDWIKARVAEYVNLDPSAVSAKSRFESFGIDSAMAVALMVGLEEWLRPSRELPLELLFEAESIEQAAQDIAETIRDLTPTNLPFAERP